MQIKHELDFARAMASGLKPYLLSDVLYWNLTGFSRLGTIGSLLLHLRKLDALDLSAQQIAQKNEIQVRTAQSLGKWRVQVEEKTTCEVQTRLDEWRSFLSECEIAPENCAPEYPVKVEHRTIIELLKPYIVSAFAKETLPKLLQRADQRLKVISMRARFVWEESLKPSFPQQDFWWLYVLPKANKAI